jgi:hypothetical protein
MNRPIIITEENYREHEYTGGILPADHPHAAGQQRVCGCLPRISRYGALPFADPAPASILIPRDRWAELIDQGEQSQTFLSHIAARAGIPCLDQNGLPYCHGFSPAAAIMALRAVQRLPLVIISGSGIAGPATNFTKRGAAIEEDLEVITRLGAPSQDFVPQLQVSKSGWKPGAEENGLQHIVTEWWDIGGTGRMFDEVFSLLLRRVPICVGLNWWGHAVTYFDPCRTPSGRYGVRFRNSWGPDYGQDGYAILEEGRGTPDQAYAPRQALASAA